VTNELIAAMRDVVSKHRDRQLFLTGDPVTALCILGAVSLAAAGLPPGPAGVILCGGPVDHSTFQAITSTLPEASDLAIA
jgi:hypothetical protein